MAVVVVVVAAGVVVVLALMVLEEVVVSGVVEVGCGCGGDGGGGHLGNRLLPPVRHTRPGVQRAAGLGAGEVRRYPRVVGGPHERLSVRWQCGVCVCDGAAQPSRHITGSTPHSRKCKRSTAARQGYTSATVLPRPSQWKGTCAST